MNEDTLYDVCDAFGLRTGLVYSGGSKWGPHVSISCPLSQKNHGDKLDWNCSCSVSISDDEPSLARCFSFNCQFKGSFYRMLEECARHKGNPHDLVAVLEKLAPSEKFTLEASFERGRRVFEAAVERERSPQIKVLDQDLMPEGRFQRYANSVPKYAITKRGLTPATCKYWDLGHDKERKCLVFPVRRYDGKLVGMTGRHYTWPDAPTKYHNYAGLNKSRYLYGEHLLKHGEPIIIVEGQIDAVATWQHLQIPTVAILGEGFGNEHAKTIAAFEPPVVYIFPDNDSAGWMAAEKVVYQLGSRVNIKLMLPPWFKMDPGDLSQDQARTAFNNAVPIVGDFDWDLSRFLTHTSDEEG